VYSEYSNILDKDMCHKITQMFIDKEISLEVITDNMKLYQNLNTVTT